MSPDQRKQIEALAMNFVESINAISPECFATTVVTYKSTALVVSNDNPVNAIMGIASCKLGEDSSYGVEAEDYRYIYAGSTKH